MKKIGYGLLGVIAGFVVGMVIDLIVPTPAALFPFFDLLIIPGTIGGIIAITWLERKTARANSAPALPSLVTPIVTILTICLLYGLYYTFARYPQEKKLKEEIDMSIERANQLIDESMKEITDAKRERCIKDAKDDTARAACNIEFPKQ